MWDGFNKRKFPRLNLDCEIVIHLKGQEKAIPVKTEIKATSEKDFTPIS